MYLKLTHYGFNFFWPSWCSLINRSNVWQNMFNVVFIDLYSTLFQSFMHQFSCFRCHHCTLIYYNTKNNFFVTRKSQLSTPPSPNFRFIFFHFFHFNSFIFAFLSRQYLDRGISPNFDARFDATIIVDFIIWRYFALLNIALLFFLSLACISTNFSARFCISYSRLPLGW